MAASPDGKVMVMTPQGEFLNVPWSNSALPELGSEIEFTLPVVKKNIFRQNIFRQKYFIALAASFILFLLAVPLWSGMILTGPKQVVAYISVDINPSIELGINYQGKVIEATGLNEDGVRLLQNLDLANLPANKAVELITNEAVKENYITQDKENTVLITVSGKKKTPEQAKDLEQQVKKVLEEKNIEVQAECIEVPIEIREQAKAEKVSSGKYVILMEAVDQGLDLTLEDMKGSSIVKAVKEAGGIPGQIISKAKNDRNNMKEVQNRFDEKAKELKNKREGLNPRLDRNNFLPTGKDAADNNKTKGYEKKEETKNEDKERETKPAQNNSSRPEHASWLERLLKIKTDRENYKGDSSKDKDKKDNQPVNAGRNDNGKNGNNGKNDNDSKNNGNNGREKDNNPPGNGNKSNQGGNSGKK